MKRDGGSCLLPLHFFYYCFVRILHKPQEKRKITERKLKGHQRCAEKKKGGKGRVQQ